MAVLKFNRTLDENYMYITVSNEELFFKYYEAIKYGRGVGGGDQIYHKVLWVLLDL